MTSTAQLASVTPVSDSLWDVRLRMLEPRRLHFSPGQHIRVCVSPGRFATYSIASVVPNCECLRLMVRAPNAQRAPLLELPVGSVVDLSVPQGEFVLDAQHAGEVVFAATGTGISPLVPMLGALARRGSQEPCSVLWGVRNLSDLRAYPEVPMLCRTLDASLSIHVSNPPPRWRGLRGRIIEPTLAAVRRLREPTIYLVGSNEMVTSMRARLIEQDASIASRIRTEAHVPPVARQPGG